MMNAQKRLLLIGHQAADGSRIWMIELSVVKGVS